MVNQFIDGEWVTDYDSTDEDGQFERQPTSFRDRVSPEDAEPGRYHLYVCYACPWAHRTLVTRALLGLEDAITVDFVDPYRDDGGWQFTPEKEGCTVDSVHGADYLREVYVEADPNYTGRVTVPVLWDREEGTIVNNESREIMRILTTRFAGLGNGVDLAPPELREDVDRILDEIYEPINNGVYRAGFAETQAAYDGAVAELFDALDRWDEVLADQRYLAGDRLTLADVRLFPTLIRFDHCYHTAFKCDKQYLHQYDNLWPYLRDLYQTPGVAETVRMEHIKDQGYYQGEITPIGPDLDFDAPHNRDRLSSEESAPRT